MKVLADCWQDDRLHPQCVMLKMSAQEGVIADYRDNPQMELPRLMYSYELKRVRYLLQCYHRTRLSKIEKFVLHVLEKDEVLARLSEKEKTHAQVRHKTLVCVTVLHPCHTTCIAPTPPF